ncbi:DUF7344 domain-containing protein [Halogeometricum limi]|nr:hypothetical protein [Halogeometricum limi]
MFDTLADATRRRVLAALTEDVTVGTDSLLDAVADDEETATRTSLHHVHLPKLERDGFVSWDRGDETVSRGPRWERAASVLDTIDYPLERTASA